MRKDDILVLCKARVITGVFFQEDRALNNYKKMGKSRHMRGFTLIELMIAVAIVGILAAIAYPSYTSYIFKSRRADALSALTQNQIRLERCYAQNFSYAGCAGLPSFPQNSTQNFYSIALTNLGATTYTLTATPINSQVKDTTCASISVNQANVKTATSSSGAAQTICWNPT